MLSKILGTATLIVVGWMAFQLLQTQQTLESVHVQMDSTAEQLSAVEQLRDDIATSSKDAEKLNSTVLAQFDTVLERIDKLQADQVKLAKSAQQKTADPKKLKAQQQQIDQLKLTMTVKGIYESVLEAELLGHEKKGEAAAAKLVEVKKPIWQLSGKLNASKDALRGLMAPIDILSGKWKRGDYSANANSIRKVLKDILSAQSQS